MVTNGDTIVFDSTEEHEVITDLRSSKQLPELVFEAAVKQSFDHGGAPRVRKKAQVKVEAQDSGHPECTSGEDCAPLLSTIKSKSFSALPIPFGVSCKMQCV